MVFGNRMANCIFCSIISKEIPCYKVYEDKDMLAFLDINPHAQGHTVLIPKKHAETVFDLREQEMRSLMQAVRKIMIQLDTKLHPDGFNVGWNHNPAGGQVVPHLHIHILPRYNGDGGGSVHSIVNNPGKMKVEEVAKLFSHS